MEVKNAGKKTKGFFAEFKKFIAQGNVLDLAVGVIIGAAFKDVVTSLTDNFINPILACIGGNKELGFAFEIIKGNPATKIDVGAFITAVINFLIMAFVIFCIVKAVNKANELGKKLAKKKEAEAAPTTKICPYCKTEIDIEATRCPHCTSKLDEDK